MGNNKEEIKEAARDYFNQLYRCNDMSDDAERQHFISNLGVSKLTQAHIIHLSQPFTKLEIEIALFQMNGEWWVLFSHAQTHITLIPKIAALQGFKDYRPISLGCKKSKGGWAALKVDLHKAYDKISWSFMKEVLKYTNFPPHWQQMLMQCVITTSMRVKINGELTDWITPTAGLRQGDDILMFFRVDKKNSGMVLTRLINCRKVEHLGRLNLRVDNVGAQSMTDWINVVMADGNVGNQNQKIELFTLLITICWSIYTQRNLILFQQGNGDVMEHGGRTTNNEVETMHFTCGRIKDSRTHWKVFSISLQQERNLRTLCYLVNDYDQNASLAMLRSIHLFLKDYGTKQMDSIMLHIPDKSIVN
ncbi:uncharacterized protein G2W53_033604 [Senna tora]|uniref:Reverse transcriptase domain-containing protein n=1 Tax=Senna tora TaxID=362788 RepID=A0A834W8K3_9FABA|nr:uncharacterized protein G2W53_033604 [Senna tora]